MNDTDLIRQMRNRQGIKGYQLAQRLGVSPARVSMLEKDEQAGAVTLKMMQRAASALGCRFEYRLVPLAGHDQPRKQKPRYRVPANT
jgi:transcriptional regulator with XRE-family HTH domain